jgi:hypothetical protein
MHTFWRITIERQSITLPMFAKRGLTKHAMFIAACLHKKRNIPMYFYDWAQNINKKGGNLHGIGK